MKKTTVLAIAIMMAGMFISVSYSQTTNQPQAPNLTEQQQNILITGSANKIDVLKKDVATLKTQTSGVDETKVSQLINQKAVTMDGKTLKGLKAADTETAKKASDALTKSQEALTKVNSFKVDFGSPEAQVAIKRWVEANMLGGKTLEQVMGRDPKTGKVNTDAIVLLDVAYASNANLKGVLGCVTELKDLVKSNVEQVGKSIDLTGKLTTQLETLTGIVDPLVARVDTIETNMPKDKEGKLVPVASQKDLDRKADTNYVDTEISRVETKFEDNLDNLGALALKKDKACVFFYASYMLEHNEEGFREWLRNQNKENEFDKIKSKAEEAKGKGLVKY